MTCEEFMSHLPDLEAAEKRGDKYCIVYFSRQQDGYKGICELDSGDALIIIDELIKRYGIHPEMLTPPDPATPFAATIGFPEHGEDERGVVLI